MRQKGTTVGLAALVVLLMVVGVLVTRRPGDAGVIVGTVTTDLYPSPLAMDTRDGRAIIGGASSGALLRTIRLDTAPVTVDVDARNHRALVFNMGGGTTGAPDPWGWIPSSARQRLSFLPRPRARTAPGSVTVLDTSKL